MKYEFTPIGFIESCYKEKFGIPRQPGLTKQATATLTLKPPYNQPEAVEELKDFSHLWLIFVFHQTANTPWRPKVRPPRLGGNEKLGVFASRSPFRPNPIGLSVVELERIEVTGDDVVLHLKNIDVVDGTPVLDIKPYIPYVDSIPSARAGFASEAPEANMHVQFSHNALVQCKEKSRQHHTDIQQLIIQTLSLDPRPAYKKNQADHKVYGMHLFDFDVIWRVEEKTIHVIELTSHTQ